MHAARLSTTGLARVAHLGLKVPDRVAEGPERLVHQSDMIEAAGREILEEAKQDSPPRGRGPAMGSDKIK
jgi:hypothetical protein